MKPNYRMRAAGKSVELYIYDFIGEWLGGISPQQVANDLKAAGRVDVINIRMNSPGGDVFDGIAIYNLLKAHPARVEIDIDGLCASISSIIAMAGDTVRMAANGMFMIHNPIGGQHGSAEDLRRKADLMDQMRDNMVDTYASKTGLDQGQLVQMMDEETWLKAGPAYEKGFVDEVTEELKMAACSSFDLSRFKNAPKFAEGPRPNPFRARLAANADRMRKVCGDRPQ